MMANEIKSMNVTDKIEYFRNILKTMDTQNETDILNVFRLINTYNTFDDDFFEHKDSYISDISEFIDIKMSLEEELKEFSLQLVTWYLSILASCDIKTNDSDDVKVDIPLLIYGIFASATLPMMSSLMNSVDMTAIDMSKLHKVRGAFTILSRLFNSHAFVASYLNIL